MGLGGGGQVAWPFRLASTAAPCASCHICHPSYCEAPHAWPLHRQGKLGPARWGLDPGPRYHLRPLTADL